MVAAQEFSPGLPACSAVVDSHLGSRLFLNGGRSMVERLSNGGSGLTPVNGGSGCTPSNGGRAHTSLELGTSTQPLRVGASMLPRVPNSSRCFFLNCLGVHAAMISTISAPA